MVAKHSSEEVIRDFGDGLVLRRATRADAAALTDFNGRIHSDDGPDQPNENVAIWTRDLVEKPHPTFDVGDFTIVEDTRTGEIVSSLNLIPQNWSYGGVSFEVGRPEMVGTAPAYRNRGLIRAQFEVIHRWSAERGHMLQGITGIPYYYRLFGYEMCLELGGGRAGYGPHVPKLKEGEQEPYHVRKATESDLGFIQDLVENANRRYLVHCNWNEALWRYELVGKSEGNINRKELRVIERSDGERVGFLAHSQRIWDAYLAAGAYELVQGVSWADVTPSVVRYLYETGQAYAARDGKVDKFAGFGFYTGLAHPVYRVMHRSLPRLQNPYAWYLRVPDLPGFLRLIQPVLTERLAGSAYCGYSGELKITFYRHGLRLVFEKGLLSEVEQWSPSPRAHSGDAAFPDLIFLQLLFGYRSLDELDYAFMDCWWEKDATYGLINALFPKMPSHVWPIS